jgi:hypothetical protein
MDYRFWTNPQDLLKIREEKVAPIDRAIRLGEKYGLVISIARHKMISRSLSFLGADMAAGRAGGT